MDIPRDMLSGEQNLLTSGGDTAESMRRLCRNATRVASSPAWETIARLNFEADFLRFQSWFETLIKENPIPPETTLLLFGITSGPLTPEETFSPRIFLSGIELDEPLSAQVPNLFNKVIYLPSSQLFESQILIEIHHISTNLKGLPRDLATIYFPIGYLSLITSRLFVSLDSSALPLKSENLPVAACYDSGEAYLLGHHTREGWKPHWMAINAY